MSGKNRSSQVEANSRRHSDCRSRRGSLRGWHTLQHITLFSQDTPRCSRHLSRRQGDYSQDRTQLQISLSSSSSSRAQQIHKPPSIRKSCRVITMQSHAWLHLRIGSSLPLRMLEPATRSLCSGTGPLRHLCHHPASCTQGALWQWQ